MAHDNFGWLVSLWLVFPSNCQTICPLLNIDKTCTEAIVLSLLLSLLEGLSSTELKYVDKNSLQETLHYFVSCFHIRNCSLKKFIIMKVQKYRQTLDRQTM